MRGIEPDRLDQRGWDILPPQIAERVRRLQERGRIETYIRYLPDGTPSPVQPNRIDPLNDIGLDVVRDLPEEDKELRLQQWCYYYCSHLGMMTRDAIVEATKLEEFRYLVKELRGREADVYFQTKPPNVGRRRFVTLAEKYDQYLIEHSESNPAVVRQEQAWMLQRMIKALEARMEEEGIEAISVPDFIALLKRQAQLHGLDSPRKIDVTKTQVTITGEDIAGAWREVQEFERGLSSGGGVVVEVLGAGDEGDNELEKVNAD